LLLLIFFEFLACVLIWWRGVVLALGDQPAHHSWNMIQQQRRADWFRNELQERPVWWFMLPGLMLFILADWFMEKWEQPPWRRAILWTIAMSIVLMAIVALTEHFGWGLTPVKV
jgi:hypothetical protein